MPGLARGVQDLNPTVHIKLCANYFVYSRSHCLHLEALEGKVVQHSLSAARVQLHQSQRVARAEFPETGNILLQLLSSDGQLLSCEL